ncbi:hypothetical protein MUK42_12321 [Musa troglodytarum]|uniref:Uncharacterized protein n=1 Tax=Musa troglodytarum TaxID=320322 RepID=A0A9E7GRH4_9LILI|nr:hypothetical protein MUK42_12321 [Musa troglodytarum]
MTSSGRDTQDRVSQELDHPSVAKKTCKKKRVGIDPLKDDPFRMKAWIFLASWDIQATPTFFFLEDEQKLDELISSESGTICHPAYVALFVSPHPTKPLVEDNLTVHTWRKSDLCCCVVKSLCRQRRQSPLL